MTGPLQKRSLAVVLGGLAFSSAVYADEPVEDPPQVG